DEREDQGLSPLEILPELITLARDHCRDMAQQNRLSHDSSDGKTYPDRLVGAGLYFLEGGENAAFSETFSSQLIHQSLLDSPEHRENILSPSFDQVGIGVIYKRDRGFYITQDFLRSFPRKSEEEIALEVKELLAEEREKQELPPLRFTSELDKLAADYTQQKAEGKVMSKIPEKLGYGTVFISRTPEIEGIEEDIKKIARDKYSSAGLGITFGRSAKNIGGEYVLVLLLVNKDKTVNLSKTSLRDQLFERMNRIRYEKGRSKLTFNTSLSYEAELIASHLRINPRVQIALPPGMRPDQLVTYSTNDPLNLSASTKDGLISDRFRTVGIGIVIDPNNKPELTYWITLIFD
ncbi:CAP domain-containing protein, partial [Acidobacteriota bacterium]